MKGTYVLLIELLKGQKIRIGKLGTMEFRNGYYAYVGSAFNGLEHRISRHLKDNKKLFWHIDFLLQQGTICEIYYKPSTKKEECEIAKNLADEFSSLKNFGSSDCKCNSHLFFNNQIGRLQKKCVSYGMRKCEFI